jgi:ribokinase
MRVITVVGSSNTDMVISTPKIPLPGETVLGGEFNIIPGGKGANQAVAASRAGGKVTFIARVGKDDFGSVAIQGYIKDNILTEYIIKDQNKPSGIAVIIVDSNSGQNSIVVAPGANSRLSEEDILAARNIIKSSDILLVQLEIPLNVVKFTLGIAKGNGVKTILNPAPAQTLSESLLSLVDIITPNESEAFILTGVKLLSDDDIETAARLLLKRVNEAVIITLGSRGAYYILKSGEKGFLNGLAVDAIDSTAAGDVFNGYLAEGLSEGLGFKEAIIKANKAAAISVTRKGAQPSIPKFDELQA